MPSPPLVISNCVQVRLLGVVAGQLMVNVIHSRKTPNLVITQALTNTVAAGIKSLWASSMGSLMATSTSLVRVGLRDLTTANQTEFLDTGAPVVGSGTGDPLPGHAAVCVTLRTGLSGKSFRGRIYISGWTEAQNDTTGNTASAASTAAANFVANITAQLAPIGGPLVVASRPALAFVDTRTWTLANGSTQVDTIGRGSARVGGIQDTTSIQSRNNNWESQRRRINSRGATPTSLNVVASFDIHGNPN